jgi:hypothetical protein
MRLTFLKTARKSIPSKANENKAVACLCGWLCFMIPYQPEKKNGKLQTALLH